MKRHQMYQEGMFQMYLGKYCQVGQMFRDRIGQVNRMVTNRLCQVDRYQLHQMNKNREYL